MTLALASWGFFFFFLVSAAFFGFAAVALAARVAVAFAGRTLVALAGRIAVAFAGRAVAVAFAGRVALALAGLVAVALAGLVAVAFAGTVRGAATGVGGATTAGAARAAAGAAANAMPICCSTFLRVEAGCTGVGFSPEVNASSSSAQASRNPAIGAQGHRLQVGVLLQIVPRKKMSASNGIRTESSMGGKRSFTSRRDQLRSVSPRGGRNKGDRARPRRGVRPTCEALS